MQVYLTIDSNFRLFIKNNKVNAINICFYNCRQQKAYLRRFLKKIRKLFFFKNSNIYERV